MKPQIVHKMRATRDAVEKVFGPKIGALFVSSPKVGEYAIVLRFPDTKVILGGQVVRALRKVTASPGPLLIIAKDMTAEARNAAADAGCDVLTQREFGWTDASYQRILQNSR